MLTLDIAGEVGLEEGLEVHDSIVVLQLCSDRTFQEEEVAWKKKNRNCLLKLAFLTKKKKHGGGGFLLHKKGMSSKRLG